MIARSKNRAAGIRRRVAAAVLSALLAGTLPGCTGPVAPPPEPDEVPASPPVQWSYGGEDGPEAWGGLDPDFELCASGSRQSPINLDAATARDLPDPAFDYGPTRVQLKNDGHAVTAVCESGNSVGIEAETFELTEFHFHHPAEHRLGDREHAMEFHFVHRGRDGATAVVAVLFRLGDPHPELDPFWDSLPGRAGEQGYLGKAIDLAKLLPQDRRSFRYRGSLTTPPCTEGVLWVILADPLEASADQVERLARIVGENNRPPQPRNQREVLLDVSRGD